MLYINLSCTCCFHLPGIAGMCVSRQISRVPALGVCLRLSSTFNTSPPLCSSYLGDQTHPVTPKQPPGESAHKKHRETGVFIMSGVRSESRRTRCDTIMFMFLQRDSRLDKGFLVAGRNAAVCECSCSAGCESIGF